MLVMPVPQSQPEPVMPVLPVMPVISQSQPEPVPVMPVMPAMSVPHVVNEDRQHFLAPRQHVVNNLRQNENVVNGSTVFSEARLGLRQIPVGLEDQSFQENDLQNLGRVV